MIRAYVITLEPESPRIASLRERLAAHGIACDVVAGVVGSKFDTSTYYRRILPYFHATGRLMAPTELGCADAHAQARALVAAGEGPGAFVFEDDVIVGDAELPELAALGRWVEDRVDLIHLGGDEGFERWRDRIRARPVAKSPEIHEVSSRDLELVVRAVGLWVSVPCARRLVSMHQQGACLSDDFVHMHRAGAFRRLLMCRLVSHPVDLAVSSIEGERSMREHHSWPLGPALAGFILRAGRMVSRGLDVLQRRPFRRRVTPTPAWMIARSAAGVVAKVSDEQPGADATRQP